MIIVSLIQELIASPAIASCHYDWPINHKRLPHGIEICGSSYFEQNVDLKFKLHAAWLNCLVNNQEDKLYSLAKYYVSTWGGVHRNSHETLKNYIQTEPSSLILAQKQKGVASWSKVLCIRNPEEYAIFDARVSFTLNALQVLASLEPKKFIRFPILPSRNRSINHATPVLLKCFHKNKVSEINNFYQKYLSILKSAEFKNHKICEIEMLLFTAAGALASKLFEKS
jgi:hypothetical protein